MYLFPFDPLDPRRPDSHFSEEYAAAVEAGLGVGLVDHDAIIGGSSSAGYQKLTPDGSLAMYRGWIIPPSQYKNFEKSLQEVGIQLRTNSEAFQEAHHLPNWFDALSDHTANSVWTESNDLDEFLFQLERLEVESVVIKDFSKSEKHYWDEAMYIPDTSDKEATLQVAKRFIELRGDYFDSGFVIREFEEYSSAEARTWWIDGSCVLVTDHPDTPTNEKFDFSVDLFSDCISKLDNGFITADIAFNAKTDALRIVEVGDAQVSDRPSSKDAKEFIQAISSKL